MNALQFIADYNENFGSPGVVRTMQVLTEQFDQLTAGEKVLYAEFLEEIAVVLQNNKRSWQLTGYAKEHIIHT